MRVLKISSVLMLAAGLLVACGQNGKKEATETAPDTSATVGEQSTNSSGSTGTEDSQNALSGTNEVAVIKTGMGEMVVGFWPDVAPNTVANFKKLARQGFYDGTCFHRVVKGFMIQGGDPLTKDPSKEAEWGTGGPGYHIDAEFSHRHHARGVISMARNGDPREQYGQPPRPQFANSAGSQFFICQADDGFLDGKYTDFGKLIKGYDVLDKIANVPVRPVGGENSRPIKRVDVISIRIVPANQVK